MCSPRTPSSKATHRDSLSLLEHSGDARQDHRQIVGPHAGNRSVSAGNEAAGALSPHVAVNTMPGGSNNSRGGGRRNNRGRWTRQEHGQFLCGLEAVGETWYLVATYVPTRTELQIRTHAQKYFRKVRQGLPFPEEPYTSAAEGDGGGDDNIGAPIDGGAAAAAAAAAAVLNGAAGPHARLPPAVGSRHAPPATAPAFDGFSSDSRSPSWASIGGEGGYGGAATTLSAPRPVAAHNLDEVWLHDGPAHAAPAFMGQQQQHYQRHHQLPPWQGYDGADMVGGRFSPPHGEAAPFRNWPVADGGLNVNLLHERGIGDVGASTYDDEDDHYDDAAALAAEVAGASDASFRVLRGNGGQGP